MNRITKTHSVTEQREPAAELGKDIGLQYAHLKVKGSTANVQVSSVHETVA